MHLVCKDLMELGCINLTVVGTCTGYGTVFSVLYKDNEGIWYVKKDFE